MMMMLLLRLSTCHPDHCLIGQAKHIIVSSVEREFFIDNLLARIHFIIVMIRWTGLAPWEFSSGTLPATRYLLTTRQSHCPSGSVIGVGVGLFGRPPAFVSSSLLLSRLEVARGIVLGR